MGKKNVFECAVADIVDAFGGVSDLQQGTWVTGPDGRRDRDVSFIATVRDKQFKALIECKDYDPKKMRRIGVELIDALDSKRKDLEIDIPIICSNAGFSDTALSKALRVGIGTIGALRIGSDRVRFSISDALYFRKLMVPPAEVRISYEGYDGQLPWSGRETDAGLITSGDLKLSNWVFNKIALAVGANQIVSGNYRYTFRMRRPLILTAPSGDAVVSRLIVDHSLTGSWYRQPTTINGTTGFYDWQRKQVPRLAPGANRKLSKRINFERGLAVAEPPGYVLSPVALLPDEVDFYAIMIHGPLVTGPIPGIDAYVVPRTSRCCCRCRFHPKLTRQLRIISILGISQSWRDEGGLGCVLNFDNMFEQ